MQCTFIHQRTKNTTGISNFVYPANFPWFSPINQKVKMCLTVSAKYFFLSLADGSKAIKQQKTNNPITENCTNVCQEDPAHNIWSKLTFEHLQNGLRLNDGATVIKTASDMLLQLTHQTHARHCACSNIPQHNHQVFLCSYFRTTSSADTSTRLLPKIVSSASYYNLVLTTYILAY